VKTPLAIAAATLALGAIPALAPAAAPHGAVAERPTTATHRAAATRLRPVDPARRVRVSIGLRHNTAALRRLAAQTGKPGSKQRYRDIRSVMRVHGARAADIRVVRIWARERGLTAGLGPLRHRMVVSGTASRVGRAFGVRFYHWRDRSGRTYIAPLRHLRVPGAIAGPATSVGGLTHGPTGRPVTSAPAVSGPPATALAHPRYAPGTSPCATKPYVEGFGMTPFGLATQYGFDQVGSGASYPAQTIAVFEIDQIAAQADVAAFQGCRFGAGAAPVNVSTINLPGAQLSNSGPALASGANGEAQLDTQLIAALAPAGASVVVVNASGAEGNGYLDALERIAALPNLSVVSISYGPDEVCAYEGDACMATGSMQQADTVIQAAAIAGVNIFVSSGDQGSQGPPANLCTDVYPAYGLPGQANVNWPASNPAVIAVGGTMWSDIVRTPQTEKAWWQEWPASCPMAGGGGQSELYDRPPWQAAAGAGIPGNGRLVPDLSLLAGDPMYVTLQNGKAVGVVGTSASAPLMAAATARLNAESLAAGEGPLGFIGQSLYSITASAPGAFTDLTTGTNDRFGTGCCTARVGFDMVFGIGTPNFGNRGASSWLSLIAD
jgi:subtilase family serine protease